MSANKFLLDTMEKKKSPQKDSKPQLEPTTNPRNWDLCCKQTKDSKINVQKGESRLSKSLIDLKNLVERSRTRRVNQPAQTVSSSQMDLMTTQINFCLNCHLIQMGSAISYWDNTCPQCGELVS